MALLSGTITYRKYRILDEVPRDFKERMVQRLPRHCFREINPETNPERSLGWVNPFSPLDAVLNQDRALTAPGFTYRPALEEVSEEELVRRIRLL